MTIKIGSGPDTWGVWAQDAPNQVPPWRQYLDEVVEAGYRWTEAGPFGHRYLHRESRRGRGETTWKFVTPTLPC